MITSGGHTCIMQEVILDGRHCPDSGTGWPYAGCPITLNLLTIKIVTQIDVLGTCR